MRLSFNADELAFQKEVRDWIAANSATRGGGGEPA